MIESHGDYRSESYLESHIGGTLYSQQRSLPKLPIPSINDTIDKFLPTALPLAKSEEEKQSLIEACERFIGTAAAGGGGEEGQMVQELQRRLVERKEGEMKDSSWLQLWWNTLGYLQVSYFLFVFIIS